jgi:hypothetical protein
MGTHCHFKGHELICQNDSQPLKWQFESQIQSNWKVWYDTLESYCQALKD